MPLDTLFRLKKDTSTPKISSYAYRCFDRHCAIEDIRFNDRMGEILWRLQGGVQLYLTALATEALGSGQGIIASAAVPDLHHFRGSCGGKDVIPLYRDAAGTAPNVTTCLVRKSVVSGNRVSVRLDPGGHRLITKKKLYNIKN